MSTMLKTLLALLLIAGAWWSMAELALSFDVIQAAVRSATATSPDHDLIFFDFGSYCCYEFNIGLALSVSLTALSGLPMALIAIGLTWRKNVLPYSETTQAAVRAGMIFQGASIAANLWLAFVLFSDDLLPPELYSWGGMLLVGAAVGVIAVPLWHRLSRPVAPANRLSF